MSNSAEVAAAALDRVYIEPEYQPEPDSLKPGGQELIPANQGPAPEPEIPTSEVLKGLYTPAFSMFLPDYELQSEEIELLAESHAAVIDKYWPGMSLGVELNAALVTVAIFGPRIAAAKAKARNQEQQGGPGQVFEPPVPEKKKPKAKGPVMKMEGGQ